MKFTELNLAPQVLDALDAMHFEECTPIQAQAIPPLLEGRDLVGVAQTGTGKTAAYLLPIISRLVTEPYPADAINCIIMSPTRELAQQIDQAMEGFSYFVDDVSSVAVYGGNDGIRYEQERRGMQLGADVIIATPGRLISHMQMGNLDLSRVSFFVLDEADRMLDMGFIDDIKKIMRELSPNRQTLLFSATMPTEIKALTKEMLHDPVHVEIAISKPAEKIKQQAYICTEAQKVLILKDMFKKEELKRTLIFSSSKQKVKELGITLRRIGINIQEMHSDLDQKQRDHVMRDFKAGVTDILVATDIISRGIDIDDIELVINYDVPREAEDYVHRVGRTARAGRGGRAVTFVCERDAVFFGRIERVIGKEIERALLPDGMEAPTFAIRSSRRSKGGQQGKEEKSGRGKHRGGRGRNRRKGSKPAAERASEVNASAPTATSATVSSTTPDGASTEGQTKKKRRRHRRSKKSASAPSEAN